MAAPPHYVLLSHSTLSSSSNTAVNPPPTLAHPTIQYQFRDDPPFSLPTSHHVLIMDYDPASLAPVTVQSLSPELAVTSLKITDAPGTASFGQAEEPKNTKMYVLETVAHGSPDKGEVRNTAEDIPPVVSLISFKQRNALLRKGLEYPLPSASIPPEPPTSPSAVTSSPRPSPSRPPAALPPNGPTS